MLAIACAISVWPLPAAQTVPAFQQDWAWPLSRSLSLQWLHAFVGLWDPRSLGQGNALPWETYAVAAQVACILVLGPAIGLAMWIAALEFLAGYGCVRLLESFGVRSQPARFVPALFYALGPVTFTRIAAGHLAYLLAYALLPLAIWLGRRAIESPRAIFVPVLGIAVGLAGSQIQFLAIAWLAILPLAAAIPRAAGWPLRLGGAAAIALCVQLQALLPLALSSAPSLYAAQPALLSFEYNNSSPFASAPVMLGYFTHYYESHALAGAFGVLYALLAGAVLLAVWAQRKAGLYAVALVALGTVLTAGLYGPLSVPLAWAFEHLTYFAVFRDLHYFAVLTAAGIALALGVGLQRAPRPLAWAALAAVVWIAVPALSGAALHELLVPRAYVADVLADMAAVAARGPGRVLWLPAEEPLGLRAAGNEGRDFTAYGPAGNPSVSDDYQNPQLAYALATLRSGKPDWKALSAMNVRYVVFRDYVRSGRRENFGTGFPMAFSGLSDAGLGALLQRTRRLIRLRSSASSIVYELPGFEGSFYGARTKAGARLFSQLNAGAVAIEPASAPRISVRGSRLTADPRVDWVEGTLGWRYRDWLPNSIYPFVWTLSSKPLGIALPAGADCVIAGAVPRGARLEGDPAGIAVRGYWKPYTLDRAGATASLAPAAGDVSAVASRPCPTLASAPEVPRRAFVFASGYDAGWRARVRGRFVAPMLANGWMMAWDAAAASQPLEYLPAYLQAAGLAVAAVVLAAAFVLARRADARATITARRSPTHR